MIRAEELENDQRLGNALVDDLNAGPRRVLAHEELIGAALAEAKHDGGLDREGAESAMSLNRDATVGGGVGDRHGRARLDGDELKLRILS